MSVIPRLTFCFMTLGAYAAGLPSDQSHAPVIVMGFVGGFVRHDATAHEEVRLADRLRSEYPSGVNVQIFANRKDTQAHDSILRLLDTDRDGKLSPEEKLTARIVLYGHSWGASEAVTLARTLNKEGIPVLLTIQVDSVRKPGEDDERIPSNVAQAVNFFQTDGLLHGRSRILAADPAHTEILGNFRSSYRSNPVSCNGFPWFARHFMRPHIEIESDPRVWSQVESLIRSELPPA